MKGTSVKFILMYEILVALWWERLRHLHPRPITPAVCHKTLHFLISFTGQTYWAMMNIHLIFILNPGILFLPVLFCFRNKSDNSLGLGGGGEQPPKKYTKRLELSSKVFSSKQGGPLLEVMVWTNFVKGSCCHNPFKTWQHVKDYNELVSKYHWKQSSHYIYTLPSPFIFLNRHLIYNQNVWIKNMEISAQKLHIHCLFWSYVSQIQKSLWQSEAYGVKVLPSKGVG